MPIYAYRCESCGFEKDCLQKISDAPLTQCPGCGADAFRKQVTAAGFQLKGSGWYVTDFRGGNSGNGAAASGTKAEGASSEASKPAADSAPAAAPASAPAASSSSASSTSTAGST